MIPGQVKEHFYKLLRVATPLAHDSRCTYVEEGRSTLSCHSLRQHCLTRARWTEQKNSLPRLQDALEEVWILHGHEYSLFQETFGLSEPDNV